VIYTSGSTGNPKGVAVLHAGLSNFALAMVETIGLNPGQRFLHFASLSFDASAVQIYPALISGAALVLHRAPAELSNLDLLRYCERQDVTVIDLPVAFWHQWIEELAAQDTGLRSSFRVHMTGGESPSIDKLRAWSRLNGGNPKFISSYGPTEATITTTIYETTSDLIKTGANADLNIGRPLPNTRVYVLDRHLHQSVPVEVTGELHIGGTGVARNYLNHPFLTAEKFIPDPFSKEPGGRLYKTGDLARFLPDGSLEFLGRLDHQVKIRGFRVEISEIETVINQHPMIQEGAVLVKEDKPGDKRIVAYIAVGQELPPTLGELRAYLKERLPDYMVPSSFVVLGKFPLTANGKVERRLLAEMVQ
jgi:amino acid adenylation domain-containing protein